ncbi:aerobactin siderophore biosynthesis iucB protein [Rutstroemia sp. NJR-2017a WRK4]|nr:aerobactin siderophore biosynthesis iucB protein [Rutstroemia sp. NJR-2017a WRK4]
MAESAIPPYEGFEIALPHPYLTFYQVQKTSSPLPLYQLHYARGDTSLLPNELHNLNITFTALAPGEELPPRTNTQWARARASPVATVQWTSSESPTIAQLWLIIYTFFSLSSEQEQFRLILSGANSHNLVHDLQAVGLSILHPKPDSAGKEPAKENEILCQRHTFWQGAGSPFGPRPVWAPSTPTLLTTPKLLSDFPIYPYSPTRSTTLHPRRPSKPTPGSLLYSRYIPHLKSHFSMRALDPNDPTHLNLFHTWQNDPRVAAGWNESGSLEHHRKYLDAQISDPHTLPILAYFDNTPFVYGEIYYSAEDNLGSHYQATSASAFDRGRHLLVGNTAFRGPHRASAWWACVVHYIFLDDPRTMNVVGEPKATNDRVLMYDFLNGFAVERWVDFAHKRSAMVRVGRERFFAGFGEGWESGGERKVRDMEARYAGMGGSMILKKKGVRKFDIHVI